jgi:hypothetical protein
MKTCVAVNIDQLRVLYTVELGYLSVVKVHLGTGDCNSVVNSSDGGTLHLLFLVCGPYPSRGIRKRIEGFGNCAYCRGQVEGWKGTC